MIIGSRYISWVLEHTNRDVLRGRSVRGGNIMRMALFHSTGLGTQIVIPSAAEDTVKDVSRIVT